MAAFPPATVPARSNYDEGSPSTPPVPTDPVEEETNINYELGVKGIFADDRLRLTAAVYYSDIENYQILLTQEVPPGFLQPHHISPSTEYTANVDGTKLSGFELSAEYRLNEQWRVDGYYNFQDSSLGPAFGRHPRQSGQRFPDSRIRDPCR